LLYRERRGPPGLEAALNIGHAGEPELLQRGGCQAGLVALVAQQDDVIAEVWGIGVAVLACRVQPPFRDVAGITSAPAMVPSAAICVSERMSISAAPACIACRASAGSSRFRRRRASARSSSIVVRATPRILLVMPAGLPLECRQVIVDYFQKYVASFWLRT
jgi:hypothetical protein